MEFKTETNTYGGQLYNPIDLKIEIDESFSSFGNQTMSYPGSASSSFSSASSMYDPFTPPSGRSTPSQHRNSMDFDTVFGPETMVYDFTPPPSSVSAYFPTDIKPASSPDFCDGVPITPSRYSHMTLASQHNMEALTPTHDMSFSFNECPSSSSPFSIPTPAQSFNGGNGCDMSMWQFNSDSPITFNSSPRYSMPTLHSNADFGGARRRLFTNKAQRASTVLQQVQQSPESQKRALKKRKSSADLVSESGITIETAKAGKHKCDFPGCTRTKGFERREHLKRHMREHDPNHRRWTCQYCRPERKVFSRHDNYMTHLRLHVKPKGTGGRTNYAPAAAAELKEAEKQRRCKLKIAKSNPSIKIEEGEEDDA